MEGKAGHVPMTQSSRRCHLVPSPSPLAAWRFSPKPPARVVSLNSDAGLLLEATFFGKLWKGVQKKKKRSHGEEGVQIPNPYFDPYPFLCLSVKLGNFEKTTQGKATLEILSRLFVCTSRPLGVLCVAQSLGPS